MLSAIGPIILSLLGLIIFLGAQRIPRRGEVTLSNAGKGSQLGIALGIAWFISLGLVLVAFPPSTLQALFVIAAIWVGVGFFGWFFYYTRVRLGYAPAGSIGYEPKLIRFWVSYVQRPTIMKENNTYILRLGFTEHKFDARAQGEKSEELIQKPSVLQLPRFKERAMIESGNLRDDRRIKIVISAPAFSFDSREYPINIDDLVRNPLQIPCLPKQRGSHHIAFDFYDQQNQRRGGIVIPIEVREREPIIGERLIRIFQIVGGTLGIVSAIVLILEKILSLL